MEEKKCSETVDEYSESSSKYSYCSLFETPQIVFGSNVNLDRANLIIVGGKKWVNGTVLRYYFFDKATDGENVSLSNGTRRWITWTTSNAEKDVVRQAFQQWKNQGIGLEFKEVTSREEAEIRIGFMKGDGSWSYIGRDVLDYGKDERTMNFGWDLTRSPRELDTALHEIGHTLGFPHEHQNPNSGIVWDEEAVYTSLAQPPNRWSRSTTFHNIIRKLNPSEVQGSTWDPDSIMHYPFEPGLIKQPVLYANGLTPAGGLSATDLLVAKQFYPQINNTNYPELKLSQSVSLNIAAQEQKDFSIIPSFTRYYEIRTFGTSDTVVVLFEEDNGELRYVTGDDDSGEERNAYFRIKLYKDHKYVLRVRLYYAQSSGDTAIMMW